MLKELTSYDHQQKAEHRTCRTLVPQVPHAPRLPLAMNQIGLGLVVSRRVVFGRTKGRFFMKLINFISNSSFSTFCRRASSPFWTWPWIHHLSQSQQIQNEQETRYSSETCSWRHVRKKSKSSLNINDPAVGRLENIDFEARVGWNEL